MRSLLSAALLALLVACGGETTAPPTPEPGGEVVEEAVVEETVPESPAPPPAPAALPAPSVPEGNLRGDATRGATVYVTYCATCHGASGKGDGPVGLTLDPRPADHTDAVYMGSLSDARVYQVIDKGGVSVGKSPLMAPWGAILSQDDIRALVGYIRQLSGT
jgi:mono/diheme cytochrome c family protein